MIVALLILIVLILLFGAGVVKGWIANTITLGCGGLLILGVLLWVGSFFGENGFRYIIYGIFGVLGLLAIIGLAVGDPSAPPTPQKHNKPIRDESVRNTIERDRELAEEFRAKVKAKRKPDNQ